MSTIVPAKIGFFGSSGSGKSTTAAFLAIGTSIHLHDRAPVYVYDTEPGWQFLRRIFEMEGVPLLQQRERSFKGMLDHIKKAQREGACVYAVDSMTHTWTELMDTFARNGRVEFQQFNQIKHAWNTWTMEFLNSPLHCYALGRLGYEYTSEEDEQRKGKKKIVKGDSKFKAGGGESFGYEPHLLIEMELARADAHNGHGGKLTHIANILKDRAMVLNGQTFEFQDLSPYKKGDYKKVWDAFLPHLNEVQLLEGHPAISAGTSSELVAGGDSDYYQKQQRRKVLLEEIEATMGTKLWPGQTADAKRIKLAVLEAAFGQRSWSATEALPLEQLEFGHNILTAYEKQLQKGDCPSTEAGILSAIENCKTDLKEGAAEAAAQPF